MKKLFILIMIVCLIFITACANSSSTGTETEGSNEGSASSVTLKLGHYFTTEDFRGKTAEHFANLVHEKSNGNIKIEVYPNEQLVKGKEGLQATAQGTIDMYTVLTTYIGGQIPLFDFFNLPFPSPLYTDEVMFNVLEEASPFLNEELKKNNVYNLGAIGTTGSSELFFSKPIHTLEEMDGIKLRGAGGLSDNALNSFGSSVTFMSSAEQYLALQTGTVDGVSTTYSSYMANNLHEVAPYWLNVTLLRAPYLLMVNQQKWDSLTSEQQQVLEESIAETLDWVKANYKTEEQGLLKDMEEAVKEKHVLSEEEWNRWNDKIKHLEDEYLSKSGENGKKLHEIRDALQK